MPRNLDITFIGLSITSSWGNGHATTYRHLARALSERGHRVLFLERDVSWYADNRDLARPPYATVKLYRTLDELRDRWARAIRRSDVVIVGSYVAEGIPIGEWIVEEAKGVKAFYDIDTPITFAGLCRKSCEYINPRLVPKYDLYLSFTGGPLLQSIVERFGSPCARPLYCSVDPDQYFPEEVEERYDLGYMGTYSDDRQPGLNELLMAPARTWNEGRFAVVGPQYPEDIEWPENVERTEHLPPTRHRHFYNSQRFTLNITRREMARAGYSPSIRLFEAAACGTATITDCWPGLEEFFEVGKEVLVAQSAEDSLCYLRDLPESRRRSVGKRACRRVLARHTGFHRAIELEEYIDAIAARHRPGTRRRRKKMDTAAIAAPPARVPRRLVNRLVASRAKQSG